MKPVKLTAAASSRLAFCALVAVLGLASPEAKAQQVGDLDIAKTRSNQGAEPVLNGGDEVFYTIRVRNLGPGNNVEAQLTDDFDDTLLEGVEWQCVPSTVPGNCPNPPTNTGTGDLDHAIRLDSGQSCVCNVRARLADCVVAELSNTAEIAAIAPDTDPDLSNNSATTSEQVTGIANIAVVKDNGRTTLECEDLVTYQVTVTNNGPNCHPAVRLIDIRPEELDNMEWLCEGLACPAPDGAGDIDETFRLEDGEQVIFIVSAEVTAGDSVTNTASYIDTLGIDPNPENDVSSDTDVVGCDEVPTLPEVALIGLALALLAVGARRLRRPSLS